MRAALVHDKSTIKAFQKVPSLIYNNDINYIPHLKQDIEKIFDVNKNKLFRDGKAERWVFYNDKNELVGRVAAFINAKTAHAEKQPTGGIGFFECINDEAAANFIFDQAKSWLAENGMEAMDGPINFGERHQFWGCLTKNFDEPTSYGMNYNPPYYQKLFEAYGFKTYFKQFLFDRNPKDPIQKVFVDKVARLEETTDLRYSDMKETGMSWDKVAEDFFEVYNNSWGGHSGFKPMKLASVKKTLAALRPVADKRLVFFVYDDDKPIAFYLSIPELNDVFKHVNGNLNWIGRLKFLYYRWRQTPKTLVGVIFGVVREWQGRGVEGALIAHAAGKIDTEMEYNRVLLTWIGDFNPKMIKVCENVGAKKCRELQTFRYLFDRNAPFERCPMVD